MTTHEWYLKVTTDDLKPIYSNSRTHYKLNVWLPRKQKPILCQRGWHATDLSYLEYYMAYSRRVFVCVVGGQIVKDFEKIAAERMILVFELSLSNPDFKRFYLSEMRRLARARKAKILKDGYFTAKALRSNKHSIDLAIYEVYDYFDSAPSLRSFLTDTAADKVRAQRLTRWINQQLRKQGYHPKEGTLR